MIIRPLGPEDLAAHAALRQQLWPDDDEPHETQLRVLHARPDFAAFGAFVAATLVAFAEATIRDYVDGIDTTPAGYLEGIYVDPAHRHHGIATALVNAVATWAARAGCTALGSDALIEDVESHAWHARAGFTEIERVVRFARPIGDPA